MAPDLDDLPAARRAVRDHDWATARDLFLTGARRAAADVAAGASGPAPATVDAVFTLDVDDLASLADAYWWLGSIDEYATTSEEVCRRRISTGDTPGAALAALEVGYSEAARGHGAAGSGWFARARRLLAQTPDAVEHGFLLTVDAYGALDAGDTTRADDLIGRVLELGDRFQEPTLQSHGLFLAGSLAIRRGEVRRGVQLLDEAMIPVLGGRTAPPWAGNLYCQMMQLCHELGDLPRAQHWTDLTEAWCRDFTPATLFTGICRVHRVQLLQVHGQWTRALREAEQAAADLADLDAVAAGEAHYQRGELHRLRGELAAADEAYRAARVLGRDPLPGLALLHLARGHPVNAASMLEAALAACPAPLGRAPLLAARIEVALSQDDLGRLDVLVDELTDIADRHDSPGWQAEASRWRGSTQAAQGQHTAALPMLREARDRWQRIDAPREVARTRVEIARSSEALGDADTAREERDLAAATFAALGAERELRQLLAQRRRHRSPAGLSPREVEVLAVMSEGGTNREIGARLHISERTVARHLANAYLKLGVASRTAAVAQARDHGLL
ncbi:LuxR C-terminal-related transcriptional regulator [Isoptericola croceus]|uniref:LuxR C-terminal-related transcriptional regulator n=1 Tax=Isoptericola croceus TaxID=3031406 RepID=UPI0023F890D3|nr:LuxR C-terminal-related transcriptional regulator [Isoptericola croceus]